MKVSNEERLQFRERYTQLLNEGGLSKTQAIGVIADEFDRGKTTIWDNLQLEEVAEFESKLQPYQGIKSDKPKILLFDIETFANTAYVWGKWQQNVIDYEAEWFVLSFCYKFLDEEEIYSVSLPDFPEYKNDRTNDYYLVEEMWKIFDDVDIVIGHNAQQFDVRKMYARFIYHGFPPPSPFKIIDTVKVARKYFNMNSNKLDDIGRYLGIGRKRVTTGWDLWKRCYEGDSEAWDEMIEYNSQDVVLLEKVYNKFKPYITNHPNLNLFNETNDSCPNCGSKSLQKRGFAFSRVTKSQRYQCNDCGAWSSGNKVVR